MDLVEAQLGEEIVGILELGVALTGEADDDVGADADCGHAVADLPDAVAEAVDGIAAAHAGEQRVVAGLDGEREGLADLGEGGHPFQDAVAHVGGVRGEGADAVQAGDFLAGGHEVEEVGVGSGGIDRGLVLAVGLDGLSEEGDLADAAGDVRADLLDHGGDRAAALAATPERDDAVGAEFVAAFDDGNEGGGVAVALREDGGPELAAEVVRGKAEDRENFVEMLGAGRRRPHKGSGGGGRRPWARPCSPSRRS